jgi:hypothetical protein
MKLQEHNSSASTVDTEEEMTHHRATQRLRRCGYTFRMLPNVNFVCKVTASSAKEHAIHCYDCTDHEEW